MGEESQSRYWTPRPAARDWVTSGNWCGVERLGWRGAQCYLRQQLLDCWRFFMTNAATDRGQAKSKTMEKGKNDSIVTSRIESDPTQPTLTRV